MDWDERDMWRIRKSIVIYFIILCLLILITPPYGDPAIVLWTSKVLLKAGFPYDPVCSKTISETNLQLCVRSPLYYSLLALSGEYWKIVLIILVGIYFVLYGRLAYSIGLPVSAYALMFPPVYLLFSRTYVDSLTAILSTILLLVLIKVEAKGSKRYYRVLLFLAPLLLILTRESAIALPLLFVIILTMTRNFRNRNLLIAFSGWITGFLVYQIYINLSGGVSYSDFQPHTPILLEVYKTIMITLTPILPWEVSPEDIQAYIHLPVYMSWLTSTVVIAIHVLAIMILIPIIFSSIRVNEFHKIIVGWLIFGFLMASGLLFLKGDIDFFRHLSYLLPVIPLLIEKGLMRIEKYYRVGAQLIKMSYVLLFALYSTRMARLYTSGYAFDACEYLSKRPELSSMNIFHETACG